MSNNPLKQYFRRPAVYLSLPSKGKYYDNTVIELTDNNELPVYPMTAIDEITTKTPDALYNGQAVVDIIRSCIPGIKDPWKINSIDLDAIFIAIKAASTGSVLEITSSCPKCAESLSYNLELIGLLSTLKSPDYSKPLETSDLKIFFGPLTYKQMNEGSIVQIEIQKLLNNIEKVANQEEKVEATKNALLEITHTTMNLIAGAIMEIQTPETTVTNSEYIVEFLHNCDNSVYEAIRTYHQQLKEASDLKPLDIKCINCGHEYQQPLTLNISDFFG